MYIAVYYANYQNKYLHLHETHFCPSHVHWDGFTDPFISELGLKQASFPPLGEHT